MRRVLAVAMFAAVAASASAQSTDNPARVTGQDDAAQATVVLNELNTDEYPDVLILATVLRDGQPLTGLAAEDFRVREDEVDQEPLTVEPQLPPLSVVVALDSSGSMSRRMAETQEAAKEFVGSLQDGDSVQLLRFARDIETMTPMSSTKSAVENAIDTISARGDTALYDALHQSIDLLAERRGRKAVVVLSDGVDDDGTGQPLSTKTIDDVLARAGEINVPVFVIGLGTEMDEAVLSDIAETTGAQYLNAPDASELGAVYGQISDQLSGQYAIRYTSSLPADGSERRVDLAALGAQDSKLYTPEGNATAAPEIATAPEGDCAPADTMAAERPDLEQAGERYEARLINITARDDARRESLQRIGEAIDPSASFDFACMRAALEAASELYDDGLIAITARDDLRRDLVNPLSKTCASETTGKGHVECLTFFRDAYTEGLISITTRDDLRGATVTRFTELLAESGATDDALAEVGGLYDEGLISITARDDARDRLLREE